MKDLQGREYLTTDQAKAGIEIEVDGDFTCIDKGTRRILTESSGHLHFSCKEGHHDIDGQLSDDGNYYVGLYPVG